MFYKLCVIIVMFAIAALIVNLVFAFIGFILIRVLPFVLIIALGLYLTHVFFNNDKKTTVSK